MTIKGQTFPSEGQPDSSSDSELEHESDGLADVRTSTAQRSSPADVGFAIALMAGFAGCMILTSRRIQPPQPFENDRQKL